MFIQNPLPQGLGKERNEFHALSFGLIIPLFICCHADTSSKSHCQSLFFFVACIVFSLSPGIFAQVQGVELNFLFNICYAARGRM